MKTTSFHTLAAALFAGLAMLTSAQAADTKTVLNEADQQFVKVAAQSGMSEVKIAQLAPQKAENTEVKTFAEMLIKHHTAANEELKAFAATNNVDLSAAAPADTSDTIKALEKESGKAFDQEFLQSVIASHKKSVDAFEEASKDSKDGTLKAWVDKMLPVLKGHLEQATALEAKY